VVAEVKHQKNVKLLVLAGDSFTPFRPLVKRLGIESRVIVKENVLDIENYLHAADAGLYASEKESFGMGVLETMSFGKPVVATRVGGVAEIVQDKRTGFLARLGDVKAMAAAVERLAGDPELAGRMGAAARERAEQEFSRKEREQYVDLYRRTIGTALIYRTPSERDQKDVPDHQCGIPVVRSTDYLSARSNARITDSSTQRNTVRQVVRRTAPRVTSNPDNGTRLPQTRSKPEQRGEAVSSTCK
jgi:hypothetical protein